MNASGKGFWNNSDARLNSPNKMTTLNPNAAEFVPSALRYLPGNNKKVDVTKLEVPGTSRKEVLDQSAANISNNSDDEAHQYWCHQLPDDITPDFKGMGEELQTPGDLSLSGLSINDGIEASRLCMTMGHSLGIGQELSPQGAEYKSLNKRIRCSGLRFNEDDSSIALVNLSNKPLDKQFMNGDQHLTNDTECHYNGNSSTGFLNGLLSKRGILEDATVYPEEFLASRFPGFRADALAELYYANGGDMNLTIEMLTQSLLKVDSSFTRKMNSKALPAPSSELEFPALSVPDFQNKLSKYSGEDLRQATNAFRRVDKEASSLFKSTPSTESMGTQSFVSAVHRLASRESEHWKYERNDKLQGVGTASMASSWIETGDPMVQLYSEMREEGRDVACLQNTCFEQAKAYMSGNKALAAKELGVKGQLYDIQMKEALERTRESIHRQRNPVTQIQSYNQAQDPLIDLHGLHVNEAIHVLKHELNILRRTARSAGRRLQVMIRVNSGPLTRASRNPVRLPIAVQQYLLDENLQFSEDQPGLLRVVIC